MEWRSPAEEIGLEKEVEGCNKNRILPNVVGACERTWEQMHPLEEEHEGFFQGYRKVDGKVGRESKMDRSQSLDA